MTGIGGKGKMGKKYYYYQCVANCRDKSCKKETVNKGYIEDLVITETSKFLTKENIDRIAVEIVGLCKQERNTDNLKLLKKLLRENERATETLFKALESGRLVEVLAGRITQKKKHTKNWNSRI